MNTYVSPSYYSHRVLRIVERDGILYIQPPVAVCDGLRSEQTYIPLDLVGRLPRKGRADRLPPALPTDGPTTPRG